MEPLRRRKSEAENLGIAMPLHILILVFYQLITIGLEKWLSTHRINWTHGTSGAVLVETSRPDTGYTGR
jgi:hypothetical protein